MNNPSGNAAAILWQHFERRTRIDELPLDDSGVLYHVGPNGIERHDIPASKLGLTVTPTARLAGGEPADNARTIEAVFRGEPGSKRDVVLLNAGAAFLVAGEVEQLEAGMDRLQQLGPCAHPDAAPVQRIRSCHDAIFHISVKTPRGSRRSASGSP